MATMRAIQVLPENFEKIMERVQISRRDLNDLWQNAQDQGRPRFFIPVYIRKDGTPFGSWVCMSEAFFQGEFDFDPDQIKSDFVIIARK